ncbi:hypothetical protein L7F22_062458 [Adiantum nelumboides]|nr:hypothetical protein [Adiantum nelumboides]
MDSSNSVAQCEDALGSCQIPFTHALYTWITSTFQNLDQHLSALENANVQTNISLCSLESVVQGFNSHLVALENTAQSTIAHVSESNAHLQQLRMQIAAFGHLEGGPTATILYKTTNFLGEEKECTE